MSELHSGYLVVLKSLPDQYTQYNHRYKGIDRTPPFSLESYRAGFDDPYLSREYIGLDGFIHSFELAQKVLDIYSQTEPAENLEIIFAREWNEHQSGRMAEYRLLGYDIASDRPFWSIVNDSPSPEDPRFKPFLSQLNENGIFGMAELAAQYLAEYSRSQSTNGKGLKLWVIYSPSQSQRT